MLCGSTPPQEPHRPSTTRRRRSLTAPARGRTTRRRRGWPGVSKFPPGTRTRTCLAAVGVARYASEIHHAACSGGWLGRRIYSKARAVCAHTRSRGLTRAQLAKPSADTMAPGRTLYVPLGPGHYGVKVRPGPHFFVSGFGNQADEDSTGVCLRPDKSVLLEWGRLWLDTGGAGPWHPNKTAVVQWDHTDEDGQRESYYYKARDSSDVGDGMEVCYDIAYEVRNPATDHDARWNEYMEVWKARVNHTRSPLAPFCGTGTPAS